MTTSRARPVVIHPLLSDRPTGMGVAAQSIATILDGGLADASPRFDRVFRFVNDRLPGGSLRMAARFLAAQCAGLLFRGRRLIFTSHHAPVWTTGRHAVVIHDLIALKHPGQARAQAWYFRRIVPRVLRCADRVIAISRTTAEDLQRLLPDCVGSPIEVIPTTSHRIASAVLEGAPIDVRRRGRMLLFLGARYPHKNLGPVLRMLGNWTERPGGEPPRLTVTACRRELWPGLETLEQSGRVVIHEYVGDAELASLLAQAAALLFLSLDEGLGLPPLEAMAAGCPVVCSDIPVLRETCGDAAWYIDPGDAEALGRLIGEMLSGDLDAEIERRRRLGCERVREYQPDAIRVRWDRFLEAWR